VLPEEYEIISQYTEVLLGDSRSPAYPFAGFVVNFNVSTKVHRDWTDLKFCVVLVISEDCEGGDLCFMEPGIRLELQNGDMVAFPSHSISHFNMDYIGKRASIVFHSDREGQKWAKNRNGWDHTAYMNTTKNGGLARQKKA